MSIFKIGTAESRRLNYHQFSGKSVWTGTFAPVVRRAALISRTQREQFCCIVACSLPLLQLKCATSFAVHCCSLDLSEATRHWSRVPSEQANWTHCQTPFCNPRILTKHNKKQKTKIQTMLLSFICVQLSCAITGAIEYDETQFGVALLSVCWSQTSSTLLPRT